MIPRYPPIDPRMESSIRYFIIILLVTWALIQIGSSALGLWDCVPQDQKKEAR